MQSISEKAEQALRIVREAPGVIYDTETSGLDWRFNFPVGYVIGSNSNDQVYVPIRHGGGSNLGNPEGNFIPDSPDDEKWKQHIHPFETELAKAFRDREREAKGPIVGHHIKFDAHFSANAGVMLGRNLSCTQNTQTLINEYTQSYSLDALSKLYGVTVKLGDDLYAHLANLFGAPNNKKAMGEFWRLPGDDPLGVDYAEGDGISTFELYREQLKSIREQELGTVKDLEDRLVWTLFRSERRGMPVDIIRLDEIIAEIDQHVADAYEVLPDGFNPRSPKQVKAYVERFATDWPTTNKGNPSFTEKWLKTFEEGDNIIKLRKWTNLKNSFAQPLAERHIWHGRVHAHVNQLASDFMGTPARLSYNSPNLQQVPKHDKELASLLRSAFIAEEGMQINDDDWSQCEPRMFAHYSNAAKLVEGYNATPFRDVHTVVAELFGADRNTTAKRMNMGMFTGMFPKAFAGHMGWDMPKATAMWNQWFDEFPEIRDFQELAKQVLLQRGYVKTLLGRRGRLEQPRLAYKAVSKIIQFGNADIAKWKMYEIDRMFEQEGDIAHLYMQVHDSFVYGTPKGEVGDRIVGQVKEIMEDVNGEPFNLRVPFVADHGQGDTWTEASFS